MFALLKYCGLVLGTAAATIMVTATSAAARWDPGTPSEGTAPPMPTGTDIESGLGAWPVVGIAIGVALVTAGLMLAVSRYRLHHPHGQPA